MDKLKLLCKNAHHLGVHEYRSLGQEHEAGDANAGAEVYISIYLFIYLFI